MNKVELEQELKELENKKKELHESNNLKEQIEKTKNEIRFLELKENKAVKTTTGILSPIIYTFKTIGIGLGRMGKFIWNNGLKYLAERGAEAGRRMAEDTSGPFDPRPKKGRKI